MSGSSTHRYLGLNGENVDVLAPAGIRPRPDLTTNPPGQTIEVSAGQVACFAQAAMLDSPRHPVRAAAGAGQVEDAQLVWDVLRHDRGSPPS